MPDTAPWCRSRSRSRSRPKRRSVIFGGRSTEEDALAGPPPPPLAAGRAQSAPAQGPRPHGAPRTGQTRRERQKRPKRTIFRNWRPARSVHADGSPCAVSVLVRGGALVCLWHRAELRQPRVRDAATAARVPDCVQQRWAETSSHLTVHLCTSHRSLPPASPKTVASTSSFPACVVRAQRNMQGWRPNPDPKGGRQSGL